MKDSRNIVYHYTDMDALINIIRNDKIVLRATNCMYLNDTQEIKEGLASVQRVLKLNIGTDIFNNHYITSFSQKSDDICMWGMYAAGGYGCAIGMRDDILTKCYRLAVKCIYGNEKIDENLLNFTNLSKNGCLTYIGKNQDIMQKQVNDVQILLRLFSMNTTILSTCLGSKNSAYAYEAETRYVVECDNKSYVKFRNKNGIIVPFVEIEIPKEALGSIVIGPTNNSLLTRNSIEKFLSINGYDLNQVEIVSSTVPYRG